MGRTEQESRNGNRTQRRKAWYTIRPLVVFVVSFLIVAGGVYFGLRLALENTVYPVNRNDATPVTIEVPKNASASKIAEILYSACGEGEEGLIANKTVFKLYVDFVGKASSLKAGTYVLSKNMTVAQIVDVICAGNPPKETVQFTILEGSTIEGIANVLYQQGLLENKQDFLDLCVTGEKFADTYTFLKDIPVNEEQARTYLLEGYVFPDTYIVYKDASAEAIINKMLLRFFEIYSMDYISRTNELGLTMDEVVTLASIVEREAGAEEDFAKVAAVFHNRLAQDMRLESCATLGYVLRDNKLQYTSAEMENESRYNTYRYSGLPLGPISSPSKKAIEAVLYPNEEYIEEGYLYFCNANPNETNKLVFAKTYEEHLKNQEKYQQYWQ